ncbi:AfsR/SARP family transcriptional regulator [Actinoalloteichus hymeniacidonis]|uniref:ATPase n=1 Tax=Actinoalloteichus hymeniacidonis TaxID=340345 RepID=A0AAC9HMI4_9PSEU|nr:BTAD domain-containing putative transcriptional regulator [Actinoalloteichus hymeniacidonis]AOS61863.1 putative ATPase [Actinoalloteichus hymeniacidonis]MBB5910117.1 putative ATPase [Actinoalloteichus hymeniacidonis]
MLTFAVLGPFEVRAGDQLINVGGPLPRRLLAILLAAEGQPVSDDSLAEGLWGDRRPRNSAGALQVYVSRLRRVLPGTALQRSASGYRLLAPDTDVTRFRGHLARARALVAGDRPADAHEAFDAALRLWRGEPYEDLADDEWTTAIRAALVEQHDSAQEESAAALLEAGDHAGAVAVLELLVHAAPYRERRWQLLALALYRSGRQADALNAVRRVRTLLAEELGVDPGPELRQLEGRILAQDPALAATGAAAATPGDRPLSSFIGRDADLALLDRLVGMHRLVTVVGPAGAGKTRLAVEWAGRNAVVRLADVTDPAPLVSAVAAAVGVTEFAGDPYEALVKRLRLRGEPLVLDNCEHLAGEVARLVVNLLDRIPALRVVATSRSPLGVDGEHNLPLEPLAADDAVTLLTDRIRAGRPSWSEQDVDRQDLRRLADALDRLPLALELAAARVRTFGVRTLIEHLDDRFTVLGRIPHGTMTPHATLQDAVAWSFDLLSVEERDLAVQLWPYEGGFPLEAAASAAGLRALVSLVDQSVVTAETGGSTARYRMLETIRAYCRSVDRDPAATRTAHAVWVRELVARAVGDLQGVRSATTMAALRLELPNLRAGLAHDLTHAPVEALRTAARLMWFWIRSGLLAEGNRVLTAALAAAPDAPLGDVVRAKTSSAGLLYYTGDVTTARRMLSEAFLAVSLRPGLRSLLAEVRYYQALVQLPGGDPVIALTAAAEAHAIATETQTTWLIAAASMAWGAALVTGGRITDGRHRLRAAVQLADASGLVWTAALSELMLAQTLIDSRDGEALPLLRTSLRRFLDEGDLSNQLAVLHNGALALDAAGDAAGAALLRNIVHFHQAQSGIRPTGRYLQSIVPHGWYEGPPPTQAPTPNDAVAILTGPGRTV